MLAFIAIFSSVLLACCTSIKPIYLQNTIDAVGSGTESALLLFACYVASIVGILGFEAIRQLSLSKYRTNKVFTLKERVMARVSYMTPQKFQEEKGQNYVTILSNEIDMLVENYYVTRLEFTYSVLVLISSIVLYKWISGSYHNYFNRMSHFSICGSGRNHRKSHKCLYYGIGKA